MTKVFKIDIKSNQLLKCGYAECSNRKYKRDSVCQEHRKKHTTKNSARNTAVSLNTGNKVWTLYKIELDGHIYYGQTGMPLITRAKCHRGNATKGKHKDSYIHQQIVIRGMTRQDIFKLMTPIYIFDTRKDLLKMESYIIKWARLNSDLILCNRV